MSKSLRLCHLMALICTGSLAAAASINSKGTSTFGLNSSDYVSSGQSFYSATAEGQNTSLVFRLDQDFRYGSKWTAKFQGSDEYSASEEWNYVNVPQAFVQYRVSNGELSFGRKLEHWSEMDRDWDQGIFQPRYRLNKLRPEASGLIGLFGHSSAGKFDFTVGLLPVNLCEFGPHFTVEDDQFTSKNPWFRPPPPQFIYLGAPGDLKYTLKHPQPSEVVAQPGLITKVDFNENLYGARLTYAYKPMPQLLLGFPSENRVVLGVPRDTMFIQANARVLYHQVIGLDQMVSSGAWKFSGSVVHERPDRDRFPSDWTVQHARNATVATASVSRYLETPGPSAGSVKASVYKLWGGDDFDQGTFAAATTLFERRYMYNEAYSLGFSKAWRGLFKNALETEARVIYDRLQEGTVFSFSSGMNFSKNWRGDFEMDILGLTGSNARISDNSFITNYRANDRVGVGMTYVF